jgi:hypothetical protein
MHDAHSNDRVGIVVFQSAIVTRLQRLLCTILPQLPFRRIR